MKNRSSSFLSIDLYKLYKVLLCRKWDSIIANDERCFGSIFVREPLVQIIIVSSIGNIGEEGY